MPPKQKQKKKKNKPKPKTQVKMVQRKLPNLIEKKIKAPVSDMAIIRSGQIVRFAGAGDHFTMRLRFRCCQVEVNNDSTGINFVFPGSLGASAIYVCPTNTYYFPSYFTQLSGLFERYKLHSALWEFEPRVNNSSTASFVLAASEDPTWAASHGNVDFSGHTAPLESSLVSLQDACTVISYGRCAIRSPINKGRAKGETLYMAGIDPAVQMNFADAGDGIIRDCVGANIMIAGTSGNQANNTVLGDLYLDLMISFYDFTTAITGPLTLRRPQPPLRVVPEKKSLDPSEKSE
jgi:hypothetical protein